MKDSSKKEVTEQYIIDALFQMAERKPYNKISVKDIAERAGISRATFYRYFESKDDVVKKSFFLEMEVFRELRNFQASSEEDYYEVIFAVFSKMKEKRPLMKMLSEIKCEYLYLDFLNSTFVEIFRHKNLELGNYSAYYYAGSLYNVSLEWLKRDCSESIKFITDMFYEHIFAFHAKDYI